MPYDEALSSLETVAEKDYTSEGEQLATNYNLAATAYLTESRKITDDNNFVDPEKVEELWIAYQNAGIAQLNYRVA